MTNWPAIWAVFAGGLVAGAYLTKVAPAIPGLRDELGLTLVESGFIATMFNLMGMLVGMLAGVLCDRLGHKRIALAGLIILCLGGVLGALAWGYASLLVARFLEGVGFIAFTVSAVALMNAAAATPRARQGARALECVYAHRRDHCAPARTGSHRRVGMARAVAFPRPGLLSAVALARLVPASRYGGVGSMRLIAESLARPANIAMAALFAFYVAQWTSIMIWLPTFLIDEHRLSSEAAALATALYVLVNAPANLTGGWLLSRGVPRGTLIVAGALIAALCEIGMLSAGLPPPCAMRSSWRFRSAPA